MSWSGWAVGWGVVYPGWDEGGRVACLLEVGFFEVTGGEGRGAKANATGCESRTIPVDAVFVRRNVGLVKQKLQVRKDEQKVRQVTEARRGEERWREVSKQGKCSQLE